jgi:hypothetical protein
MNIDPCIEQAIGRRRIFWTTRAEACGSYQVCGTECAIPGLSYKNVDALYPAPPIFPGDAGYRTISNDEWLQGLILNILNTRARTDARCPTPAAVYGHWSESYRSDGLYIGSTLWNAAEKSYTRTADAVKAVRAAVLADMGKLIALGIATDVDVDAVYRGSNSVTVTVVVTTSTGRSSINLAGSFVSETWVWRETS